jgi:hypothetical protein
VPRKSARELWAIDCETDPFLHDRVPEPFIWGAYNGSDFLTFDDTATFAEWLSNQYAWAYAHNGGKFDFIYLLPFIRQSRVKIIKSRVVEMEIGNAKLRDSWSIIPGPLSMFQKTEIDYALFENGVRQAHMPTIIDYLKDDCVNLFVLVKEFRERAGVGPTIAGCGLNFAKRKCDLEVRRTNAKFDEIFRRFYFGGRCEAFQTGSFKSVDIYDIKSAYPFAMLHEHASGVDYTIRENWSRLDPERISSCFLEISCESRGAFPVKSPRGELTFPNTEGDFFVTGWEYITAVKHNLISKVNVTRCFEFYDTVNFKPYIDHWFAYKDKADADGDKARRVIGKFMLNAFYGKFAQNPVHYRDYKVVEAGTTPDEGWDLEHEIGDVEIHSRSTLYELKKRYGDDWQNFPVFYNVATASSITGFCRAMLLDAIHTVGRDHVLYCDTDCIFLADRGRRNVRMLRQDGKLGSWEKEGTANPCFIAGKKLYGANIISGKKKGEKVASKGAHLSLNEIERIVVLARMITASATIAALRMFFTFIAPLLVGFSLVGFAEKIDGYSQRTRRNYRIKG